LKITLNFMTVCFKDKTSLLLLLLLIGFITPSCRKNENTVGDDFVGALVGFNVKSVDTTQIVAYTSLDDSVPTRFLSYYLLGDMNDPDFGSSEASIITQYIPPTLSSGWNNGNIQIDSIVLQLKYVGKNFKYGNIATNQTITVYELAESLKDSSYRSDRNYQYDASKPIGSWTGKFKLEDSIRYTYAGVAVSLPPHLRIKLDDAAYINKFKTAPSSVFASIDAFQAYFKGLVIIPETSPLVPGDGGIVHIDLKNDNFLRNMITSVVVYYDSTQKIEFPIYPDDNIKYNKFSHQHTVTIPIQPRVGGTHQNVNYVKSMAGLKTRIQLPNLFDFVKNQNIAINGAELVIPIVEGTNTGNYTTPVSMRLFDSDSLGRNKIIVDAFDGTDYYGGSYNSSSKTYSYNIIRYVQNLLTQYKQQGLNYNYGLNLFIQADNPVSASRVIIDTRPGKIKLKLSYTVIK